MSIQNLHAALSPQSKPLNHLRLYRCHVEANELQEALQRHSKTLEEFILEEIVVNNGTYNEIFNALGNATCLKELVILVNPNCPKLLPTEVEALILAMGNMPHLTRIQFSNLLQDARETTASIEAIRSKEVERLILHDNKSDSNTLEKINLVLNTSAKTLKTFEVAQSPELFANQETNTNFLNALNGCANVKYIGIHQNHVNEEEFRQALSFGKAAKFEVRN